MLGSDRTCGGAVTISLAKEPIAAVRFTAPKQLAREHQTRSSMAATHQHCTLCAALRRELEQLRALSQQQARRDYHQCALMFQQLQQLVKLNASLVQRCGASSGGEALGSLTATAGAPASKPSNATVSATDRGTPLPEARGASYKDEDSDERERLQALVVRQAKEIGALRAKLPSSIAIPPGCQVQASALIFSHEGLRRSKPREGLLRGERGNFGIDDLGDLVASSQEVRGMDDDDTTSCIHCTELEQDGPIWLKQNARQQNSVHLRKLPLASLHAQLKRRDAEIRRLQQLASKLETQLTAVIAKKQETARSYQEITRVQQQQLKKYFALLRQLSSEKRVLESKLADLGVYAEVLEKKLVAADDESAEKDNRGVYSRVLGKTRPLGPPPISREWDASVKTHPSTTKRVLPSDSKRLGADSYILNVRAG